MLASMSIKLDSESDVGMSTILSNRDTKVVDRILSENSGHFKSVILAFEQNVLPRLKNKRALLDIGPGSGTTSKAVASHFDFTTYVEPNEEFRQYLEGPNTEFIPELFQRANLSPGYDFVLCSHMLYHVELREWHAFIEKMISLVNPGGAVMINMLAQRGYNHDYCVQFNRNYSSSRQVINCVKASKVPYEVISAEYHFTTWTYEDMFTLCRYLILEDLFSPRTYEALSQTQKLEIDHSIRLYAMERKTPHGNFRLTHEGDYVLVFPG